MKRIFPFPLVLILWASSAFSQDNRSAQVTPLPPGSATATAGPRLEWELVNPFRFIHDQNTIDDLKDIYKELKPDDKGKRTAFALERKLQELADKEVDYRRATARQDFMKDVMNCDDPKAKKEVKRICFEPYLGWFARLAEGDKSTNDKSKSDKSKDYFPKTCWNSATHKYRTDGVCADYIYPKTHNVRVWIESSRPLEGNVTWFVDAQSQNPSRIEFRNCDAKNKKAFCIEFSVPYHATNPPKVMVSATLADGSTLTLPEPLVVVDRLIVGLGDSYAAGEGNPDMPAKFTQGKKDRDALPSLLAGDIPAAIKGTERPQKDKGEEAEARWLDKRCHRSMYSYQFKTALHLALSNPRQAITFVSFSCSGAKTEDIISKREKALEGGGDVDIQLDALREALALRQDLKNETNKMREIDYLLLSTGGNDIKFASYVIYALLSGRALEIYGKLPCKEKGKICGVNEERIKDSFNEKKIEEKLLLGKSDEKGNYYKLHNALLTAPEKPKPSSSKETEPDEPKRLWIKGCKAGEPCKRILLTPYPDILTDENGDPCTAIRKEFDNPFGEDMKRAERITSLRRYVVNQIQEVQNRKIKDPSIANTLGWTVVEENAGLYSGHGFCARTKPSAPPVTENFEWPVAENFELPKWENKGWSPFDPRQYKPYASRTRWIRIPVDAKLVTDQMSRILKKFKWDLFLEDDRSIIMHPTAEGYSNTADANLRVIEGLER